MKSQSKAPAAQSKAQPRAQSKAQPAKAKPQQAQVKAQPAKVKATSQPARSHAPAPKSLPSKTQPAKAKAATKSAPSKSAAAKAPAAPTAGTHKAPAKVAAKPRADRIAFFEKQRQLLLEEKDQYIRSAEALKAQADSLALEHEPGDVQFDEEGGEGGTSNIDRELDLVLSAQARSAAAEIDRALAKIEAGTYGFCEQCGDPIPDARLQALPYAALCVSCKSGGLSARR
ncbi:MAG TPA: TraR/DksA C4-type zinc finger protein [Acidimicrobiales bacterium]